MLFNETDSSSIPTDSKQLDQILPVFKPDFTAPKGDVLAKVTWLGHSSVLLQAEGVNVLTDPIFSERASPFNFAGPKRYRFCPF